MTNQPLPARVGISDQVLFQEIEGECVLLDMTSEQYFGLDDVGTKIWQLLVTDGDTARVVSTLTHVYDVDEVTLRNDVANLIRELSEKGLVKILEDQK
jgi:hypothetical protein